MFLEERKVRFLVRQCKTVRCYTPADFILLIEGTGLAVERGAVDGNTFRPDESSTVAHPLWDAFSYVVQLVLAS